MQPIGDEEDKVTIGTEQKTMHQDLRNVGLRAQATAVGLVHLCRELQSSGVLDEAAVNRIKAAIADEITLSGPRTSLRPEFQQGLRHRLDSIFSGERGLGKASELSFATKQDN